MPTKTQCRMPSLDGLRAFEVAARRLSFTEAGQELFVTQGAVSQRIKALEQELGAPLFHRRRAGLALTLGGSSLLYLLIQRGEATAVTSLLYLVPPTTALMAWLMFGEAFTPLMMAAMYGSSDAVKLLLDEGADTAMKNQQGMTALEFAQRGRRPDAVGLITTAMKAKPLLKPAATTVEKPAATEGKW